MKKKKISLPIITALFVLFLFSILFSSNSFFADAKANEEIKETTYKYYTSYLIQQDDTLWDIAQEFITEEYESLDSYIKEVKSINNLRSDLITEGCYITLPYYSPEIK